MVVLKDRSGGRLTDASGVLVLGKSWHTPACTVSRLATFTN